MYMPAEMRDQGKRGICDMLALAPGCLCITQEQLPRIGGKIGYPAHGTPCFQSDVCGWAEHSG